MTLHNFEIFIAVCETMNMTVAAERMFISQSAISQAVNELEKHYNVHLFERFSRKLYLTSAGEKLYSYAQHMIGMNADIEKEMKVLSEDGIIRIGASVTVATYVLPALVSAFRQLNPQIDVEVCEDNTEKIEKLLLSDKADIGLVEGEVKSADILSTYFSDDELTLICGAGHRFVELPVIEPHELEKEDFIVREPGSGTRKTFEDVMAANRLGWNAKWVCNSMDTIKEAVMAGLGVSVMPGIAVKNEIDSGKLYAKTVEGICFYRTFKIIHHKNKYITSSLKKFIDFCVKSIH
ncbi:MAG: LysR family transcriptional regulator [Clostridiales bacterium]|nr:LysR family transcriptional regulator [Clostridiales bacterium]